MSGLIELGAPAIGVLAAAYLLTVGQPVAGMMWFGVSLLVWYYAQQGSADR